MILNKDYYFLKYTDNIGEVPIVIKIISTWKFKNGEQAYDFNAVWTRPKFLDPRKIYKLTPDSMKNYNLIKPLNGVQSEESEHIEMLLKEQYPEEFI